MYSIICNRLLNNTCYNKKEYYLYEYESIEGSMHFKLTSEQDMQMLMYTTQDILSKH